MSTLTEFLLARIAEDESDARKRIQNGEPQYAKVPWGCPAAARVLAECEAKRRIVATHPSYGDYGERCATCQTEDSLAGDPWPCLTLRHLAAIYADHEDYDESWRP